MGLPVGQRRSLDEIEDSLRASDPRLASLFTIFTRLNRDEEMPAIEQLMASAAGLWARLRVRLAAVGRRSTASPRARFRTAVFFPMALAAMVCTMLIGAGSSGAARCISASRAAGTSQLHSRTRTKAAANAGGCGPLRWPDKFVGK
jgi:hypothetical protein